MHTPAQRLMRSRNEKVIAGVAGGLAHYLAIDPVLIRLVVIGLVFTGVGVILYPILWLVMPLEPVASATATAVAEGREVFVAPGSMPSRARFDPMTGQPNDPSDAGEEVPINNVDTAAPEAVPDPRARRNQLLGYALLIVGGVILISMIAGLSGLLAKILFPVILIGIGVYLLRRNP